MGFKSAPEAFYRRGCKPIVGSSQERQKAERPGTRRAARSRSINPLESRQAAQRFVAKRPLKATKSGEAGHAPSRAFQEHKSSGIKTGCIAVCRESDPYK